MLEAMLDDDHGGFGMFVGLTPSDKGELARGALQFDLFEMIHRIMAEKHATALTRLDLTVFTASSHVDAWERLRRMAPAQNAEMARWYETKLAEARAKDSESTR
jgi:hypothetical protein